MPANPGFVRDVVSPDRISLTELAKQLDVDVSSLYRWVQRGVRARNGQRVRLVVFKLAGRTHVRREDLEAFIGAVNCETSPTNLSPSNKAAGAQRKQVQARSELERAGVKVR